VKLPEPLFAIINPVMGLFLRSPVHWLLSGSLMLITFTGRKSGRKFTTPVRYIKDGETIRCFTGAENQWWRNVRGGAEVQLRIRGKTGRYTAYAIDNDPEEVKKWLLFYLGLFPQDAAYHDIKLNKDKSLVAEDLERASHNAIVVEANPVLAAAANDA
jgi:deazaflavin-dependent oxidoreductase (nitroreductase family)